MNEGGMKLAKYFGVRYPLIHKLQKEIGTRKHYLVRVALQPYTPLIDALLVSIYDSMVVVSVPNGMGGTSFHWLTYEDFEYPAGSYAARAIVATEAAKLFPDDSKGRKDRQAKIDSQREEYITDHWHDVYDEIIAARDSFYERQAYVAKITNAKNMVARYAAFEKDFKITQEMTKQGDVFYARDKDGFVMATGLTKEAIRWTIQRLFGGTGEQHQMLLEAFQLIGGH